LKKKNSFSKRRELIDRENFTKEEGNPEKPRGAKQVSKSLVVAKWLCRERACAVIAANAGREKTTFFFLYVKESFEKRTGKKA